MTDAELAFAAGLLEGEGTVRISAMSQRNMGILVVSMTNTDRSLVDWMQARWPGYCKPAAGLRDEHRPAWVWVIAAQVARDMLVSIEPFVVSTRMRDRIVMAKRWQELKSVHWRYRDDEWSEEHFELYLLSSHLNKRGVAA